MLCELMIASVNCSSLKPNLRNILKNQMGCSASGRKGKSILHGLKQLESDIVLWENNIGFFARSRNAETMIRDVEIED